MGFTKLMGQGPHWKPTPCSSLQLAELKSDASLRERERELAGDSVAAALRSFTSLTVTSQPSERSSFLSFSACEVRSPYFSRWVTPSARAWRYMPLRLKTLRTIWWLFVLCVTCAHWLLLKEMRAAELCFNLQWMCSTSDF